MYNNPSVWKHIEQRFAFIACGMVLLNIYAFMMYKFEKFQCHTLYWYVLAQ